MSNKKCCFVSMVISGILMLICSSAVFAGDIITFFEGMKKYFNTLPNLNEREKALADQVNAIVDEYNNNHKFTVEIGGSYSMNETDLKKSVERGKGKTALYELKLQFCTSKGVYPYVFTFKTKTSTKYEDSTLKESLNNIFIEYKRYYGKWLKVYCFAERFSDEYLSIDHRYEIGTGFKFEYDFPCKKNAITPKRQYEIASINVSKPETDLPIYLWQLMGEIDYFLESSQSSSIEDKLVYLKEQWKSLKANMGHINDFLKPLATSYEKNNSRFSLGGAVTVLKELEKATIITYLDGPETNPDGSYVQAEKSKDFSLPADHRYRLVLRPTATLRLKDDITLKSELYWKIGLGKPHLISGKHDNRTDLYICLEFALNEPSWAKKVSIVSEYALHFDNAPPMIPDKTLNNDEYKGKYFRYIVANNKHQELQISLIVAF